LFVSGFFHQRKVKENKDIPPDFPKNGVIWNYALHIYLSSKNLPEAKQLVPIFLSGLQG
jgi:hypothetical protein